MKIFVFSSPIIELDPDSVDDYTVFCSKGFEIVSEIDFPPVSFVFLWKRPKFFS